MLRFGPEYGTQKMRYAVAEDGALYGYHASRARLETRSQIASNAAEAVRLRAAQKGSGR